MKKKGKKISFPKKKKSLKKQKKQTIYSYALACSTKFKKNLIYYDIMATHCEKKSS